MNHDVQRTSERERRFKPKDEAGPEAASIARRTGHTRCVHAHRDVPYVDAAASTVYRALVHFSSVFEPEDASTEQ